MSEILLLKTIKAAARARERKLSVIHWGIKSLPEEIGDLTELEEMRLHDNELTSLPREIRKLKNLRVLWLSDNQYKELPAEVRELTNLRELHVDLNQLTELPAWIGRIGSLKRLSAYKNQLTELTTELGELKNLTELYLSNNQLTSIPAELGKLTNLTELGLKDNRLTSIPTEMGKLTNLTRLELSNNQLTSLPAELGKLTNLKRLELQTNQLTSLPAELGKLTELHTLYLYNNPLESPPPEVVKQGTRAVLAYLRELAKKERREWVSKLLLVGEGGVGKTSLLKRLLGEGFDAEEDTTHGISVEKLEMAHPSKKNVKMQLNTWDFGGQQIYHATHQFFLTNRALFVLVWDARHGWEAGKLYNWLDRIQAKAPESPVMIVAAHIDERDADLPLDDLWRKYPQIAGHYKVSNKDGTGIEDFKAKLAEMAAGLPLMGEEWPASWLDAAEEIRGKKEEHISPKELYGIIGKHKVEGKGADVLAQWMHELGDILYFREDEELKDTVILNPVWVTEAISDVLESEEVVEKDGILTRENRDKLWRDVDDNIREHFLRLMEKFDLSYRTLENREISLVVERLPLDPPDYEEKWDEIKKKESCKEISMKFELSSVPAGIPTWFIARSHRFTTHTHWRLGALFADSEEERHFGLIEASPHEKIVRLTARGLVPYNFFVLLRDGLELTLARFPGLRIKRTIPCPGHGGEECSHEFDLAQLEKAVERMKPPLEIQCPETFENVSVPGLLFGLHWSTEGNVITRIDELEDRVGDGQVEILTELRELRELRQREFLKPFNDKQRLAESHCPNVFAVLPKGERHWLKNIFGQKMVLQLYCQAPGQWHTTYESGRYEIKQGARWLMSVGPYVLKLSKVLKYAAPLIGPGAAMAGASIGGPVGAFAGAISAEEFKEQIKLMEELAKKLGDEREITDGELLDDIGKVGRVEEAEGAALRALRKLLDEVDPKQNWGGLKKILTPEGHYLWLCAEHAEEYKR